MTLKSNCCGIGNTNIDHGLLTTAVFGATIRATSPSIVSTVVSGGCREPYKASEVAGSVLEREIG